MHRRFKNKAWLSVLFNRRKMGRAPCCDKNGLKKGPWTPDEDQKLTDYIQKHGYGNWRTLPKNAGLQRCGKSCRLRWTNYLRPDIKRGKFSFEEEESIIQLHSVLGNKWSAIAARLPGRTDNEIKNYWNTHIRKRLLRMGIDPVTHIPRLDLLDLSSILRSSSSYNNPSQMIMNPPGLFGTIQDLVTPEILRLATSLLSASCRQRENPVSTFFSNQNQEICNNNIGVPIQNNQYQEMATSQFTSSNTDTDQLLVEQPPNYVDQFSYFDHSTDHQWQSCGGVNPSLTGEYVNGDDLPFHIFESGATTLNSNSNGVNTCSTEDERESYCSDMINFDMADVFNVDDFM